MINLKNMQKKEAIQNYQVKDDEKHLYHVCFTKVLKDGKRTKDVHKLQPFSKKEYENLLETVRKFGLAGITQQDEMELAHDPRTIVKPVAKPKGRPPKKD